jgi:outer membrane protein OmpA-like peptidoglycan-associated protein
MRDDRGAILARRRRFLIVALAGVGCTPAPAAVPPTAPVVSEPSRPPEPPRPREPEVVDSDGDGVPDADDRCPTAKGTSTPREEDDLGCPPRPCLMIVPPSEIVVDHVTFPRNDARIPKSFLPLIDELVRVLEGHPAAKLEIHGHTQKGEAAHLAKQRATAVHDALVKKGVAKERLSVFSEKDTKPADAADPAKNRRVTFVLNE